MRLRFLGTGTSAGVPVIGCACDVCTSSDPRDRRLRTSATVEFTDPDGTPRVILIDTGPDLRQQVLSAGLDRLDAILYTHNHVDHTFGLDEVRRFNVMSGGPLDLYADAHTLDHLRRVYRHIFEPHRNVQKSFIAEVIAHEIAPLDPLTLFGMTITPLPLLHGRLPILGFRFDPSPELAARAGATPFPLAYCTDVSAVPPETWGHLEGLGALVLDALRIRHHPTHLTLDQAVEIAGRVGAPETWLIHMTHDLPHAQTEESLPPGVRLAHDGLILGG